MKIVIANWKMNPSSISKADILTRRIRKGIGKINRVKVIICPPFIYLDLVRKIITRSRLYLGAQDLFWRGKGSFTGAISGGMLRHVGCDYVIVGHSERRLIFQETNEVVNNKVKAALRNKLKPVLCIGEQFKEKRVKRTYSVLGKELKEGLRGVSKKEIKDVLIAYEPIWAVGASKPCSNSDIIDVVSFIKEFMSSLYDKSVSEKIKILYGGSVNTKNAKLIISNTGVDGLLIGRASLKSNQFNTLVKSL